MIALVGEQQPADDAGGVPVAEAADDVLQQAARRGYRAPNFANE